MPKKKELAEVAKAFSALALAKLWEKRRHEPDENWTREKLANKLGCSRPVIIKLLNLGKKQNKEVAQPKRWPGELMIYTAKILGIDLDTFKDQVSLPGDPRVP